MKYVVWFLVLLLLVFHQDYWQWNDTTLDFGFLPRNLTYHSVLSLVTAGVWMLATKFCWPESLSSGEACTPREDTTA
ncbi:MAG: hypothetical protein H6822_01435 [Planctomycetaceae bacterium]|nr:hypothetical protein [Planctomycetales bacterium]MCB9920809.1 hypothetical protein [Planctomycetaceae bacterium]